MRAAALVLAAGMAAGCQAGYVISQGYHHLTSSPPQIPLEGSEVERRLAPDAAEKLRWVPRILEFARVELGLDPGDSYTTYADLGNQPVSYVVTASHALALVPYEWQFPFAGRVPYKGFFEKADAESEAARLREKGYEALVTPVTAFSTLGWFRDPVVPSMLEGNVADLADVIIHETTHRTLYFPGSTSFNESLATHVAREGTLRFLAAHDELSSLVRIYRAEREASRGREEVLLRLRADLDALYRSPLTSAEKLRRKAEVFATAGSAYRHLVGGTEARIPESNAFVLSVARYHELEPLIECLESKLGGPAALVAYLKRIEGNANPVQAVLEALVETPAANDS